MKLCLILPNRFIILESTFSLMAVFRHRKLRYRRGDPFQKWILVWITKEATLCHAV
ncbi:hypothetical protein [Helicobacter zhangjianzhongii]|uniref:Uncharacterized protein n=1 Tax=Helicobacter zhangjianzhongii TaxID=2974574 RepID=A0ACC6FSY6_9HELI|nr:MULTISPECIES: hypothetical protein [unclassified Helicobacter]MDL0080189.1 hypothetical protein [Helicobacter sp. CPD2-1]MDL0082250.1 hypothetical protein [Helicobacter sp. XJK30-2]